MSETDTPPRDLHGRLIARILDWLGGGSGPVAIHAGHFMLLPRREGCVPAVLDEVDPCDESARGLIETLIARFPIETWQIGLGVARAVQARQVRAGVVTLVNDWYFLRGLSSGSAACRRRDFYSTTNWILDSYSSEMRRLSLNESVVEHIGPHRAFVSEYWLRRRAERRLKRLARAAPPGGTRVRWRLSATGEKELVYNSLERECRLLLCGHADCADEVMELLCLLHEAGYRRLVNLIPRECERPVNAGCERAIALFDLCDLAVLNVAMSCLGGSLRDDGAIAHHVYGERLDDGTLETAVDSEWWRS